MYLQVWKLCLNVCHLLEKYATVFKLYPANVENKVSS